MKSKDMYSVNKNMKEMKRSKVTDREKDAEAFSCGRDLGGAMSVVWLWVTGVE